MLKKSTIILPLLVLLGILIIAGSVLYYNNITSVPNINGAPVYSYRIVAIYPHDPDAFTEGLAYANGYIYEGTGLNGQSSIRQISLENGSVLRLLPLQDEYFGEGITVFGDHLIELTWQSYVGFVYSINNFTLLQEFHYNTEGWGLTNDGNRLIMSDGTATLYFLDPETYAVLGQIQVHDGNGSVTRLNELEYVNGEIYANIWQTNLIAQISPQTGQILGYIDLTGLSGHLNISKPIDVLNGIAFDGSNDRLFVTGKLWPSIFQIELVPEKN